MYAELEKIGKSDKSVEDKTKAAKQLVQDKLGDSSQFKSLGFATEKASDLADSGRKWLEEQVPGLGGLTKVRCSLTHRQGLSLCQVARRKTDES